MDGRAVSPANPFVRLAFLFCLAAAPFAVPAGAQSLDAARTAYAEGRFVDAARIAGRLGSSEGYALAARSLVVHARHVAGDGEKEALFERAVGLARKAVGADPRNANAHLQLARAIGRLAQAVGAFEAANQGYADRVRESTETALRLDPGLAAAYLSLGRWHAGIVGAAGSFVARLTFGARERDALAAFERALRLAPGRKVVPLQYALGLLALDEDEYREKARGLLRRAVEIPAKDAYDRILHEQAVDRLRALDASGG